MRIKFSDGYEKYQPALSQVFQNFSQEGILVGNGNRNIVKEVSIGGRRLNFKFFKRPNIVNKTVYKFFRKSKAVRSFEYAQLLLARGLLTPAPVAYVEFFDVAGLTDSFYVCEHLTDTVTLETIIANPRLYNIESILQKYTQVIFALHEQNIEFLDNSPGNFLISGFNETLKISMVDLNRMRFHKPLSTAWKESNFCRLTRDPYLIGIISAEYARLANSAPAVLYNAMIAAADRFHHKSIIKMNFKKVIKFYRPLRRLMEFSVTRIFKTFHPGECGQ